jgi:hypothetical protein
MRKPLGVFAFINLFCEESEWQSVSESQSAGAYVGFLFPCYSTPKLWAKTSVKGGQYLTGRLGGVKILVLENRDRKTDDDPSHHLFFAEAAPPQGGQEWDRGHGHRTADW